jgi:glycosyltransferase A (GT-A) superfamily protein (DUF2064 family)
MIDKALLVISRTPLPKEVRVDLVPPLTHEEAAEFHASLLFDIVEQAALQLHLHPYIYFDPVDARSDFEHIFRHASFEYKLKPAVGNRLSDKIAHAVENIFSDGVKRLAYLDVDAALISQKVLKQTFELMNLDDDVVVLASDQADQLALVGLKKPHTQIFDALNVKEQFEVAMKISTPLSTMMFTLSRLQCLRDVSSLKKLYQSFMQNGQIIEQAPRTTAFLKGLKDRYDLL